MCGFECGFCEYGVYAGVLKVGLRLELYREDGSSWNVLMISLMIYDICNKCLGQSQLLVEGVGARLAAQELGQRLHLVLAATLLQHLVAVAAAMGLVHGVVLEHGVEHVGGVDLGTVRS